MMGTRSSSSALVITDSRPGKLSMSFSQLY